jgi:hypothetical protein
MPTSCTLFNTAKGEEYARRTRKEDVLVDISMNVNVADISAFNEIVIVVDNEEMPRYHMGPYIKALSLETSIKSFNPSARISKILINT